MYTMENLRLVLICLGIVCGSTSVSAAGSTAKPFTCITCSDLECFSAPRETVCGASDTYCMSLVVDDSAGNRVISKGCTNTTHCTADYYQSTRVQPLCRLVDHQVTGTSLRCFFCCKGANCNVGPNLQPEASTLFNTTAG